MSKMSNEEIKNWLIENAISREKIIDLSQIDFGDYSIDCSHIRAASINNNYQISSSSIDNSFQIAVSKLDNSCQLAEVISNNNHEANKINNSWQAAHSIDNSEQGELDEIVSERIIEELNN